MDKKLGTEPAFPKDSLSSQFQIGMSKRFYAACEAMNLSPELIDMNITDEDVQQDDNGYFVKGDPSYFCSNVIENYSAKERFKIVTSYNHRLVRALYDIADELLKQENE